MNLVLASQVSLVPTPETAYSGSPARSTLPPKPTGRAIVSDIWELPLVSRCSPVDKAIVRLPGTAVNALSITAR